MEQKTALYDRHVELGGKMVPFAGFMLPVQFKKGILEEHMIVREHVGMFDCSHMGEARLDGPDALKNVNNLFSNQFDSMKDGSCRYAVMLYEDGGCIDDLIVYFLGEDFFRMVVNASTREKDLAWIGKHAAAFDVQVELREDLAIIAVQGPQARARVLELVADADREALGKLGRFAALDVRSTGGEELFVARTGYTGEDGFEILLAQDAVVAFWNQLLEAGVKPAGLGARDTLRLEAGMNLYGQDMDEDVSPYEAALAWTVAMDAGRAFIGRDALEAQLAAGDARQMIGLVMDDKGVLRHGQKVLTAQGEGEILSGTFSPTLGKAIAFARVPQGDPGQVRVDIRGREVPVRVVKFPFVREGQAQAGVLG